MQRSRMLLTGAARSIAASPARFDSSRPVLRTSLEWTSGSEFKGSDDQGNLVNIGCGSPTAVSPMKLLLLGLGGCASVDIVRILKKQNHQFEGFSVSVDGQQASPFPRPFDAMHLTFTLDGAASVPRADVERAISLSLAKYCSVHASLSPSVDISWTLQLNPSASVE